MDAIASTVIQSLSSLTLQEFGLIWNLKDDAQRMKRTVSAIRAVLLDAESKAPANQTISNWLEELKDVFFDADDLLDDFSTQALRRKVMTGNNIIKKVKIFFSRSNQIAYGFKMGHKIREIRERLDDIAEVKNTLQLSDCHGERDTPVVYRQHRQTYSFVREDEVIGRKKEKKLILSYLLDTNVTDNVSIIPIDGIGGVGKTALAQLVYNDEAVREAFEQKMWVCVSDEFDIRQICQNIIGHDRNSNLEQVQQDLRYKIRGKKYLLVLDDVWNEDGEQWLKLKRLLMEGGKGSMIIVTTRSEIVAKIMGTHRPIHLEGLDFLRSWKLFCQVAFEEGKEPNNSELAEIGKGIVKKCAGVPLAIRTIGSLLYSRNLGQSDWQYFRDVEFSKIDQLQQKDRIFAILKLSYDHLPSFLKNCFAYCSLFPKDYDFKKKTLIQLWVAEGFIQPSNDSRCVEDVGHEYFKDLLSRSFFQDVSTDEWGDISGCKMHDLIHDLAQLVAGNEYAVVTEVKEEKIEEKTRHLSFYVSSDFQEQLPISLVKGGKLRTFLLPCQSSSSRYDNAREFYELVFGSLSSMKCLRVLTLTRSFNREIPKSIKELKHLRYLDLSGNIGLLKLPPVITSLHNLQTLKLSRCHRLIELPADINKMVSLRHLELDDCNNLRRMPHGLGQLTCLQTLTLFAMDQTSRSGSVTELSGLNNLSGGIVIAGLNYQRGNAAKVESAKVLLEKRHLRELELYWNTGESSKPENLASKDEMILRGLQPHHSIKRLKIGRYCGKSLPDWIGNLSSLLELRICYCDSLTSLPEGMLNLKSLHTLSIAGCPVLKTRCLQGAEDWPKIAHIPEVIIR